MLYSSLAYPGEISLFWGFVKGNIDTPWWVYVAGITMSLFGLIVSIRFLSKMSKQMSETGRLTIQRRHPVWKTINYGLLFLSVIVVVTSVKGLINKKNAEATVNKILVLPEDTYIGARIPFCVNVEGRPDDVFSSTLGKLPWWSGIGLITHVPSVELTALGSFQVGVGQFSEVVSQVSQGLEDNPLGTITGDEKKVWVIRLKIPTPEPRKDMGSIYIDSKSFRLAEKEAEVSFGEAWDACGHEATRFTSEGHSGLAVAMTELVVGGDVRAFNNTQSKAVDEAMKRAADPNDHSFNGTNALESARETTRAQITKVIEAMNKDIIAAKAKEGVETVVVVNFSDGPPQ